MKVGSLFTGYGGLDITVGGDLAWYAEIEPAACQVLAHHYPNVPNLGDITKIDWSEVEPVDVITGGYPCQPFSHAGNRKGKNDVRHLWPNVLDAIRAIRPRYAILENVSGHLTLGFADVLADLAEIGWSCEWGTYRASDVGAPHRRERIFIVAGNPNNNGRSASEGRRSIREGEASRGSHETGCNGELEGASDSRIAHANSQGSQGSPSRSSETQTRGHGHAKQGAGASTADTSGKRHGSGQRPRGLERMGSQAEGSGWQTSAARQEFGAGSVDDAANTESNKQREPAKLGKIRPELGNGVDAGSVRLERNCGSVAADTDWGKYAPAIARWESVLERNAPDPVVMRSDKRRLNPRFVKWMMGLPDGWVTGHGLSAAKELKMLGNGVVPQQAHAAITQLLERTQQ